MRAAASVADLIVADFVKRIVFSRFLEKHLRFRRRQGQASPPSEA
jgi:hypothetical protein